jgi:hypothetical protein
LTLEINDSNRDTEKTIRYKPIGAWIAEGPEVEIKVSIPVE